MRKLLQWAANWFALRIVSPDRLRRCRLQIVFMELRKGDQSGEHLKKVLAGKKVGLSSAQFYMLMAEVKQYAELFYVQMPFGQQKIPYFHLKRFPPREIC